MRIPIALYLGALAVRALVFGLHADPAYPDSSYYTEVARSLQAGHGFSVDFIYAFLDVGGHIPADPVLPIPSNGFWMPLASLVALPGVWLLGTPLGSALPFMLIGALSAPLTWLLARDVGAGRGVAMAAGAAAAIGSGAAVYSAQPDNLALYEPIATAALWLTARALRGSGRAFVGAGLLAALGTLSRTDGFLLAAVLALAVAWDRRPRSRIERGSPAGGVEKPDRVGRPAIPWACVLACFGLFVLLVGPWLVRQELTFGSISPSSGSLFVTDYEQTNSVTASLSLASFLDQGPGAILSSRLLGLVQAGAIFGFLVSSMALAPFVLVGAWRRRRSVDFGPCLVYAGLLFCASVLLFPAFIPHGTFLHSAVGLLPYSLVLGFEGAVACSAWLTRRIRSWTPEGAARLFLVAGLVSVIVTAVGYAAIAIPIWNRVYDDRTAARDELDLLGVPDTDVLLSADPAGFYYQTGRPGVVTPSDSLEIIRQVALDYHARWLILERVSVVPPLIPVLEGGPRPAWLGAPVYVRPYTGPKVGDASDLAPALAIYPVCVSADDKRCETVAGFPMAIPGPPETAP